MRTAYLAAAALCIAGGAQAQKVEQPASPTLETGIPAPMLKLSSFPRFYSGSEGLPPADPQAPDYWRADPKLYAGVDFGSNFGVETTFTNPGYQQGLRFRGTGPRLAEGVPMGVGGYDLDLAAKLTLPVDDRLSAFGTLGVSASARNYHDGNTFGVGPLGSLGATYKMNNKQTATVEVPLGMARKSISGARGGYGASLKLGF